MPKDNVTHPPEPLGPQESMRRFLARQRGEDVPKFSPGRAPGYTLLHGNWPTGPAHYMWAGDEVDPKTGRKRARRHFEVTKCESCGATDVWLDRHHRDGNTSNNEPSNIRILCRSCHMKEDGRLNALQARNRVLKTHCKNGHDFTPENTRHIIGKDGGPERVCRQCANERVRQSRLRRLGRGTTGKWDES